MEPRLLRLLWVAPLLLLLQLLLIVRWLLWAIVVDERILRLLSRWKLWSYDCVGDGGLSTIRCSGCSRVEGQGRR